MLLVGPEAAARRRRAGVVGPLALAHRVERQHHVAEAREALAALLIDPGGLAVGRVPHLEQHARIRRLARGRDVEVRRDVEAGLALVDDLLQPISRAVERADRPGVQRRALGHAAHQLPERLASPTAAGP